ncbi:hypothetical protein [Pusillimonas sp.]|uniref:hypothetical protein n=1 Tax=Pusillimonas sp. TaxID=3040095 RepID=UPI0037C8B2E3
MATNDSTESFVLDGTTWNKERKAICLEGVWELDKIARTLPDMVTLDENQEYFIVRAMAGRMLRLTSMLMSAISDDVPNDKLARFITFDNGQG